MEGRSPPHQSVANCDESDGLDSRGFASFYLAVVSAFFALTFSALTSIYYGLTMGVAFIGEHWIVNIHVQAA